MNGREAAVQYHSRRDGEDHAWSTDWYQPSTALFCSHITRQGSCLCTSQPSARRAVRLLPISAPTSLFFTATTVYEYPPQNSRNNAFLL